MRCSRKFFHSFILLGLLSVNILSGCEDANKVEPPATVVLGRDNPSQTSFNTQINFSSSGLMRAILHAGRIRTYDLLGYTLLDSNVHVDFFDRMGKHSSILTSRSAKIFDQTKSMTAYTNVHIVSDSGTIVDTDSLEWDNPKQSLHSEANVRIQEKNGRLTTGRGFESDQSLTHYTIMHPTIVTPGNALDPGTGNGAPPAKPKIPDVSMPIGSPSPFSPATPTLELPKDTSKK